MKITDVLKQQGDILTNCNCNVQKQKGGKTGKGNINVARKQRTTTIRLKHALTVTMFS